MSSRTSSNNSKTSGAGCNNAATTVWSKERARPRRVETMSKAAALSSPVVMLSKNKASLYPTNISPVVTRFFSPPETPRCRFPPMFVSAQCCKPRSSRVICGK
ncbi:hypothetical protein F442_06198 [Phytophthora nicotianae P10297]|uniref:Uncharacterized protein n=1 Tax=Phytophthora nicotianae P10297 TaxID=1317064 RepID=W2ZKP2_PHYNI|nr:hypothetical protein F442_06198 [Phytophthora nicotianae P10297]